MPFCVNCGDPLECTCKNPVQPIGQTVIQCPKLAKGKLWIHVTDDLGVNVPGVLVEGKSKDPTDGSGMAKYEELDPGSYPAAMMPSLANLKDYDVSNKAPLSKMVTVKAGVLAYVQYVLIRKATLRVRFVVKSGANLATETPLDAKVPVKVTYAGDGAQSGDDNWTWTKDTEDKVVSAGKYTLTPTLSGLSKADYEYVEDPQEAQLLPGGSRDVVFEVVKKAELKAKFVLKAFGPKFPDNVPFKTTAIPVAVAPKAKGTTDSKSTVDDQAVLKVTPASYTVTPNFKVLDPALFEWKDSQTKDVDITGEHDDPVVFEIGRKAKLRVEIVYKHDHKFRLRDTEDGSVDINLKFLGNEFNPKTVVLPPAKTKDGVAEFASLSPGQYEITPDFDQLAVCKFDWTAETRTVLVFPDADDPVVFEVEPLYQKVQFIAHCLMTIPTQEYVESDEDKNDRVTITTHAPGNRTFTFKKKQVVKGRWDRKEVNLDPGQAEIKFVFKKPLTLALKPGVTINHLPPKEVEKFTILKQNDPLNYEIQMGNKVEEQDYTVGDLTGSWQAKYHGHSSDQTDLEARVTFIKDTLDKAFKKLDAAKKHPTVLKVFMVPECFFQGLHGVYLKADADDLVKKLQEAVQDAKWKDWVFSFGTVNWVSAAPTVTGISFTRTIHEMKNQAPLIRGGVGPGRPSTRMIPKLLNSAELADDLIPDPNKDKNRTQAVNADVQFMAIPSEIEAGSFLEALLVEETAGGSPGTFFGTQGLTTPQWNDLFAELKVYLAKWGMARVIREIRGADNTKKDSRPVGDWMFGAYESGMRDAETHLPTVQEAISLLIQAKWKDLNPTVPLQRSVWGDGSGKRQAVLTDLSNNIDPVAEGCGYSLAHQKAALKAGIDGLLLDDAAAKDLNASQELKFKPSMFPLWKKLLGLYKTHKGSPVSLDLAKGDLSMEEYLVIGPRKPGPWFDTLGDGSALDSCKRLVFGLEICADHADQRLNLINKAPNEIGIDIQLVPSAGMSLKKFAARAGGFLFNCDGWNQKPNGGRDIPVVFDGPNPFEFEDKDKRPVSLSPAFPHSALATSAGKGAQVAACLTPDILETPSAALSKVIFGYGPGEIHFYPMEPLPQ